MRIAVLAFHRLITCLLGAAKKRTATTEDSAVLRLAPHATFPSWASKSARIHRPGQRVAVGQSPNASYVLR